MRLIEDHKKLRIAWWNVNNFYHFKSEKVSKGRKSRWPQSRDEYEHKCQRVDLALKEMFKSVGSVQVLCLGEITKEAAEQLRDRIVPDFRLISLDVKADDPTLQVAILYAPDCEGVKYREQPPILVPRTPRGTRPMAVLDIEGDGHVVRLVACHWQARIDEKGSKRLRFRMADFLAGYSYDFLNESIGSNHIAIIGDLNEEPFEENMEALNAHRHRGRSQATGHWADDDVKRTHLYNTSWRLLGEKHPYPTENHGLVPMQDCAGTYYWESDRSWRHFDQLIVSGGLLNAELPFIDETEVVIVSSSAFLTDGLPVSFSHDGTKYRGLSDHLPILAKIHI